MKTLSDLTLKQLTAIFGTVAQVATSPKTFNSRAKALSRLEALLAEKNLTIADAMRAADIETDEVPATAPTGADEPAGTNDAPLTPEPNDGAPVAPLDAETSPQEEAPTAAAILVSSKVINDTRDWLVRYLIDSAGLDPETAVLAALRAVTALKLPEPAAQPASPRQPRTGTKQDQVIALLRRPQGATLAEIGEATGWASHTCRGILAGALKKRLGLTITSTKEGRDRIYKIAG